MLYKSRLEPTIGVYEVYREDVRTEKQIAVCFSKKDAEKIAVALNAMESNLTRGTR